MIGEHRGCYRRGVWQQRLEKGGGPQVACLPMAPPNRISVSILEKLLLPPDGLWCVIGDGINRVACIRERGDRPPGVPIEEFPLPRPLQTVPPLERTGRFVVIADERVECFVRNPVRERGKIENPDQRLAAANTMIEEGQWFFASMAFEPQRNTAEING